MAVIERFNIDDVMQKMDRNEIANLPYGAVEIDRNGTIIDCYEQNTVQTEDGSCTPKCLLPPLSEDEACEVALELIREAADVYHCVFHPYFHPVALSGRGGVPCQRWFREVLAATRDRGLPSVTGDEWIRFNDARRATGIEEVSWDLGAGELTFDVVADLPVEGLTIMLPPCDGRTPLSATADGEPLSIAQVGHEKLGWTALEADLSGGEKWTVAVRYEITGH